MEPNIPGFKNYYLSEDNRVFNLTTKKEITLSKQTNSINTYRCNLYNDEGVRVGVALNRLILLSSGERFPTDKNLVEVPSKPNLFINKSGEVWSAPKKTRAYGIWLTIDYPKDIKKYPSVTTHEYGKLYIHQLLAITFLDKDYLNKGLCVMHLDDDKHNFNMSNLKIGTYSENNKAAYETGANSR